jgi:hypothetical protein
MIYNLKMFLSLRIILHLFHSGMFHSVWSTGHRPMCSFEEIAVKELVKEIKV